MLQIELFIFMYVTSYTFENTGKLEARRLHRFQLSGRACKKGLGLIAVLTRHDALSFLCYYDDNFYSSASQVQMSTMTSGGS